VRDLQGVEIARGISNYASTEAKLIAGKPSQDIPKLLGYSEAKELIHRDNLVRLAPH
jgi:glutamate 5-kinase